MAVRARGEGRPDPIPSRSSAECGQRAVAFALASRAASSRANRPKLHAEGAGGPSARRSAESIRREEVGVVRAGWLTEHGAREPFAYRRSELEAVAGEA